MGDRNINEITDEEFEEISLKLNRTKTSILQKGEEIPLKIRGMNKKREITEVNKFS